MNKLAIYSGVLILGVGHFQSVQASSLDNTIPQTIAQAHYASLVNPFIGTGGAGDAFPEGNTYPGAVVPWGMVSVSPHTHYTSPLGYLLGEPAAASGYHFAADDISGFGLTHLSGVGCVELGAPVVAINRGKLDPGEYASTYSEETAVAGYYRVKLDALQTLVETSATSRTGALRFIFDGDEAAYVVVDVSKNLSWGASEGHVEFKSDNLLVGWSQTGDFCTEGNEQKIFFAARIDHALEHGSWQWDGWRTNEKEFAEGKVGGWWKVDPAYENTIFIGVSYVSSDNALANLKLETQNKSFTDIATQAIDTWNRQLGKIRVSDEDRDQKQVFYTALYHSLLHPNVFSDVNGDYRAYQSDRILNDPLRPHYSVFSMWDTYRNVHSLLSLVYPRQQQEMLYSLESMLLSSGVPPQWELLGSEVNMMVGDPVLSIFAEASKKGFALKQPDKVFSLLYQAATEYSDSGRRPGNASYLKHGYIPHRTDNVWGAVSTTLEYSYHDWALAQWAQSLGKESEHRQLMRQSAAWENLFDSSTNTFRPKDISGEWLSGYDLSTISGERWIPHTGGPGFVEGNAYHYAFMLPHGIERLIERHGGNEDFVRNLDEVFSSGEFVLWNEPDMSYPYLFAYAGETEKTQTVVQQLRSQYFFSAHDGLPGNDDAGTLSAWFVFSALGFYPVNPASGEYRLGLPAFDRIEIDLDPEFYPGKKIIVRKEETDLPGASFNQQLLTEYAIEHGQLITGGELVIEQ